MTLKKKPTSRLTKLIIIVELFFVSYLLYTLTESVYRSYQIDLVIAKFEEENNKLAEENRRKLEDFEYFSSENYYEKIAKQNLGLVNPGEEIIIIPKGNNEELQAEIKAGNDDALMDDYSNSEKWYIFFFDNRA